VLMPSARAGSVSTDLIATPVPELGELLAVSLPNPSAFHTEFLRHPPPCQDSGSSFSVPLRI
jgi:hypothetical protein